MGTALAQHSSRILDPSGVPRGVIFLTGAMGRVRDYNAERVCKALGEPLLGIYDQGNKVPKRLPNAAFAVLFVSVAGHDLQDQVAKRKQPQTRVLCLSHKWAVAEAQLRAVGFSGASRVEIPPVGDDAFVDVSEGKVTMSRFATVPFLVRLMRRYPKFTGVDLVVLRHSALPTPVRASKSLAALITACQEALREIGSPGPFIQRTMSPVAPLDKWLKAAKACLKAEERVEPSPEVAGRIAFIDSWAGAVQAIPKDSEDWSKITKKVAEVIDVPGWNARFDTIEFRLLCHARGVRRGGTAQDVIDAAESVSTSLAASHAVRKPVDTLVVVTPAASTTPGVVVPVVSAAATDTGGEFFPSLFRALPALSLADCAWLRQQPEVWPARACPWLTCYALYSNGAKGVDASAKQRSVSDDALLEAAYSLVPSGAASRESVEWAREFRVLAALATHIKSRKAGVVDPAPLGALLNATEVWGWHFREGMASELLYLLGEAEAGSGLLYSQRGWGAAVIDTLRKLWTAESAPAPQVSAPKKAPAPVLVLEEDMPEAAPVQPAPAASMERVAAVVPFSGTSENDGKDFRAALRRVFPGVSKLMEVYGVKSLTFGAGGKASWERERVIVQRETGEESLADE